MTHITEMMTSSTGRSQCSFVAGLITVLVGGLVFGCGDNTASSGETVPGAAVGAPRGDPVGILEVRVLDGRTGRPLESVGVSFSYLADDGFSFSNGLMVTDSAGRTKIGLPEAELLDALDREQWRKGRIGLEVQHRGYAVKRLTVSCDAASREGGTMRWEVRLERGIALHGSILLPGGRVVSGNARVCLQSVGGPSVGERLSFDVPIEPDGAFRAEDLPPGEYQLALRPEGTWRTRFLTTAHSDAPVRLPVRAEDLVPVAPELVVTVRDESGNPVPTGRIWIQRQWAATDSPIGAQVLDGLVLESTGTVRAPVPGRWRWLLAYNCRDAQGCPLGPALVGPVGEARESVDIVLSKGSIEGGVLGPEGQGLPGEVVRATPVRPLMLPCGFPDDLVAPSAVTDARGKFRLQGIGAFLYELGLKELRGRFVEDVTAGVGDRDIELRVRVGKQYELRLVDSEGSGRRGTRVSVYATGGSLREGTDIKPVASGITDQEGRVTLCVEPDARYRLVAEPQAAFPELREVSRADWRPHAETILLPSGWFLRGKALRPDGTPFTGAILFTQDPAGVPGSELRWAEADIGGNFLLPGLKPGQVTVWTVQGSGLSEGLRKGSPRSFAEESRDIVIRSR